MKLMEAEEPESYTDGRKHLIMIMIKSLIEADLSSQNPHMHLM
jgi:hypothetical protein